MKRTIVASATLLVGGALAFGPGFSSAQTEPGWLTFHGNAQRDGIANVSGPTSLARAALYTLPKSTNATPPVVGPDGTAYVGGSDGKVYALDPAKTGQFKWTFATTGPIISSPTLSSDGKTLYVGSQDGDLYAVDTTAGAKKWATFLGGPITSPPLLRSDGATVYAENTNGILVSLKTADGTQQGTCSPGGAMPVGLAASPDGNTIYVVAGDAMYAVPATFTTNCGQAPEFYLDGNGTSTPAVDANGNIYVGTVHGVLDSFTPTTPASRWTWRVPNNSNAITSTPTFLNGNAIFGSPDGYLVAVSQQSGSQVWQFHTGGAIGASPAVSKGNNLIYVGSEDGTLYALNADGTLNTSNPNIGTSDESSPALDKDGSLWVSAATQVIRVGAVPTPPAIPPTGTVRPTAVVTSTPTATAGPAQTATPTATATVALVPLSITVKGSVSPGKKETITVKSAPSTVVHLRVNYPNGDHQSHSVTTNASGTATYSFKQAGSKITHNKSAATVIAKAGSGAAANSVTATYKIKWGTIDVSAEPRTVAVGKVVDIFIHAHSGSKVVAYLLAPNGKKITLRGTTGKKGLSSSKYKVAKGLTTSKNRKVVVLATFQRGGSSTKTNFTIK